MSIIKRNGLFDFGDFFDVPVLRSSNLLRTDVKEEDDKYVLEIEVPGYNKDEIKISFDEGYLIVETKKENESENNDKYLRRERNYSNAYRKYYFGEVNHDEIHASFNNGILTIEVTKKEPTVKSINIE